MSCASLRPSRDRGRKGGQGAPVVAVGRGPGRGDRPACPPGGTPTVPLRRHNRSLRRVRPKGGGRRGVPDGGRPARIRPRARRRDVPSRGRPPARRPPRPGASAHAPIEEEEQTQHPERRGGEREASEPGRRSGRGFFGLRRLRLPLAGGRGIGPGNRASMVGVQGSGGFARRALRLSSERNPLSGRLFRCRLIESLFSGTPPVPRGSWRRSGTQILESAVSHGFTPPRQRDRRSVVGRAGGPLQRLRVHPA